MKKYKRKKAFWGAIIDAALSSITGGITAAVNAKNQRDIAQSNLQSQQELIKSMNAQNKQKAYQDYLNNLNANSGVYNKLYQATTTAKMGGKFRKGRKKCEWGSEDTGNLITSLITGVGGLVSTKINTDSALEQSKLALAASNKTGKIYGYQYPNFGGIQDVIAEKDAINANIKNNLQKANKNYFKSLYLS